MAVIVAAGPLHREPIFCRSRHAYSDSNAENHIENTLAVIKQAGFQDCCRCAIAAPQIAESQTGKQLFDPSLAIGRRRRHLRDGVPARQQPDHRKCRDAVASSHPTYRSSKSSTLKCSQTVAVCPIPRLMALKLICFARPCESSSTVESISRKSYHIGTTSGAKESLIDLLMLPKSGFRYWRFLEVKALIIAAMILFIHEATAFGMSTGAGIQVSRSFLRHCSWSRFRNEYRGDLRDNDRSLEPHLRPFQFFFGMASRK
jgi:hypothetical protein